MQHVLTHFETNSEIYQHYFTEFCRLVIGIALSGLSLGSLYLLHFIYTIYSAPRQSRFYIQMREHVQTETLIRYFMMIGCVGIITWLIFSYFTWGPSSLAIGLTLCLTFLSVQHLQKKMKETKKKEL